MKQVSGLQNEYQPAGFPDSLWSRISPWKIALEPAFRRIADYLELPETRKQLMRLDAGREYPTDIRRELNERQLGHFFSDESSDHPGISVAHIGAITNLMASISTSLSITVGVNPLSFLPVYFGGRDSQLRWLFDRVEKGAYGSILLSELRNGSNLLRNETYAEPGIVVDGDFQQLNEDSSQATHYRLFGEKQLINGGNQHDLFVVFARTKNFQNVSPESNPLRARSDYSIFLVERDQTTEALPRWQTIPAPAADISGIRFHGTIVPAQQRVGREGGGFSLVQKTLSISRGAIGAMAAGLARRAVEMSVAYAQQRNIYGKPIIHLGAIADHLLRMRALEMLINAMGTKASAVLNARGSGGIHYATAAKYACCVLAEELVTEGRYIHGARGLLAEHPYHQVVADVPLYGTFDGTSHLMLEQLHWRLAQMAQGSMESGNSFEAMKHIYTSPAMNLVKRLREPNPLLLTQPAEYLKRLAEMTDEISLEPLMTITEALLLVTQQCREKGYWEEDQGIRFDAGKLLAFLESMIAMVELVEPGCRKALGMSLNGLDASDYYIRFRYAYGWFGGRMAADIRHLAMRIGMDELPGFKEVESAFWKIAESARQQIRKDIKLLI